jgi:hypothetical protein
MEQDEFGLLTGRFIEIPGKITPRTPDEFINQFNKLLDNKEANEIKGIVYLWLAEKPVKRLKGECRILYIGKTNKTFAERYRGKIQEEIQYDNWPRIDHIIKEYDSISFLVIPCTELNETNPERAEGELLKQYFQTFFERPPLNKLG